MGEDPCDSRSRRDPLGELGPGGVESRHVETDAPTPVIKYEQIRVNYRVPAWHSAVPSVCQQALNIGILLTNISLALRLYTREILLVGDEALGPPDLSV